MSTKKHSDTIITNESTLQRRAWIDRAVASARGKIDRGEIPREAPDKSDKPFLYLVNSDRSA